MMLIFAKMHDAPTIIAAYGMKISADDDTFKKEENPPPLDICILLTKFADHFVNN